MSWQRRGLPSFQVHWQDWQPTPLNLFVQALFEECGGKHSPSGRHVVRDHLSVSKALPVCARCGVPYGRGTWT